MMRRLIDWLYDELLRGRNAFEVGFMVLGVALQVAVYCAAPSSWIMLLSGMAGIFSVVLCSQGKILSFAFGFVQVVTYMYISYRQQLYGEVLMQVFYFFTMIYGVAAWRRNYGKSSTDEAPMLLAKRMRYPVVAILLLATAVASLLLGYVLATYTRDSDPYFDAFTTMPAIPAQILMVSAYREQWILWLMIDVLSTAMWVRAGNGSMAALYAFWVVNCVYGYWVWTRSVKQPA